MSQSISTFRECTYVSDIRDWCGNALCKRSLVNITNNQEESAWKFNSAWSLHRCCHKLTKFLAGCKSLGTPNGGKIFGLLTHHSPSLLTFYCSMWCSFKYLARNLSVYYTMFFSWLYILIFFETSKSGQNSHPNIILTSLPQVIRALGERAWYPAW